MALSPELISQFAKIVVKDTPRPDSIVVNGTAKSYNGKIYVQIDGSDQLTPIASSTVGMKDGDRVSVRIKNHSASVTGNATDPSAGKSYADDIAGKVDNVSDQIAEFEIVIADKVSTSELDAQKGRIDELVSDNVTIKEKLTATEASIDTLTSENATINGKLTAQDADIENLKTTKLDADVADIKYATVENLEASNADIHNLQADYGDFKVATADKLNAANADIENLKADKLSATDADIKYATIENLEAAKADIHELNVDYGDFKVATADELKATTADIENLKANKLNVTDADIKYANIDFTNIGEAAIKNLFTQSGIIEDLVVSEGHITGKLVGVTIIGDLIEGGTIKADKLVVQGSDGLYYKLNVSGESVAAEQTEYNSLNGSIITAQSITAEKINVDDLVAFNATIGGFKITDNAIYSGVKSSATNTTAGVYMSSAGEFAVGDTNNFLRCFKDTDGKWKVEISAQSIKMSTSNTTVEDAITEIQNGVNGAIKSTVEQFYLSTSHTSLAGGSWSNTQPAWTAGKYIWRRTLVTYVNGSTTYTPSENGVCITGNTGATGSPGTSVTITSTVVDYQASSGGTTPPTGTWSTSIPSVAAGQYLWTRTRVSYSDGKSTTSYSVSRQGTNGANGAAGTSVTVKSTAITYAASTSGTATPSSGWQSTIPSVAQGSYLWTKTVVTYSDGKSTTAYSVSRQGEDGERGPQGVQGPKGENGQTLYTWIKYADTPTSGMSDSPTGKEYIGIAYNKTSSTESSTYSDYTWSKIVGDQGPQGPSGANGKTLYTWVKYADSATGSGISDSPTGKEYIGLAYNKTTATESTTASDYTWSLIKGEDGTDGVRGTRLYKSKYEATANQTGLYWSDLTPTVSTADPPRIGDMMITPNGNLFEIIKVTTTSDGSYGGGVNAVGPLLTSIKGPTGSTGNGISSIADHYQVSSSNSTAPTTWVSTVPALTATNKYLWNYETITYTNGSSTETKKRVIGVYGDKGANGTNGVGVKSSAVTYQAGSSGTTVPTGTWSTSIPSVAAGQYLWTKTVITYTDGKSTTSYSVGRMGQNGANGSNGHDGKGVKSTAITYQAGTSQTSAPTGSWSSSVPALSTAHPYLWTRTVITYTDNTTSTAYSVSSTLESIEVGGRNLAEGTASYSTATNLSSSLSYGTGSDTLVPSGQYLSATNSSGNNSFYITNNQLGNPESKMQSGEEIVVSCWLKCSKAVSGKKFAMNYEAMNVKSSSLPDVTTNWQKAWLKGTYNGHTTSQVALTFYNGANLGACTVYVSSVKIEKGNKPTDWTPAPEDIDQSLSDTQERVDETYAITSSNSTRINELLQTTAGFDFNFKKLTETVTQLGDQTSTTYTEQLKYIKFIDGEIWLGKDPDVGEDDFKVVISNQKISFTQNNAEVAYISNNKLHITDATIQRRLDIGNFAFIPRSNGNLSFISTKN